MRKQTAILLIVLAVAVTVFAMEVVGQINKLGEKPLKGIKSIVVDITKLDPDFEKDAPFTRSTIQTDIELKLRMAGIKVVNREEWVNDIQIPWLVITLKTLKVDDLKMYCYYIDIELQDTIHILRNEELCIGGITWNNIGLGYVGTKKISTIRDRIKDDVDKFINDYLEMNPKE